MKFGLNAFNQSKIYLNNLDILKYHMKLSILVLLMERKKYSSQMEISILISLILLVQQVRHKEF